MEPSAPPPVPRKHALFGALALVSGVCALGYEVLYLRHVTTLVGDVLWVHASLLSTFLLGVGVGARLAHHAHRWLAPVEAAIGLYALALPPLTAALGGPLSAAAGNPLGAALATAALVALPAFGIGFGLPLFSAYVKAAGAEPRAFARVYGLYNLGAFLGITVVELFLVRALGIRWALATLGVLNLIAAVALAGAGSTQIARPPVPRVDFRGRAVRALALASVASAAFQMMLLRTLDLTFGPHRENFAVGLSVILLGIALGASVAARRRVPFVGVLALLPVALGLSWLLAGPARALGAPFVLVQAHPVAGFGAKLAWAAALGLAPMVLFGVLVPALLHEERAVAEESGYLLWVSALGNAIGYVTFVAVLHPVLSGAGVVVAVAAACALAALVAGARPAEHRTPAFAGALALAALLLTWNDEAYHLGSRWPGVRPDDTVRVFKWGGESATLVRGGGDAWVSYNGHPSIVVASSGNVNLAEIVSGVVPALTAARTERALVLGLGTGITAGSAARTFDRVDVAEINRAFMDMAPMLTWASQDLMARPNARIHHADGRAFLAAGGGPYDAIINSIPAPTYYSASKIYTLEFYELVRAALAPGGVFATWLSPFDMTEAGLETVLATLHQAFGWCDLWLLGTGYYMATCAERPAAVRAFGELGPDPELRALLRSSLAPLDPVEYLADVRLSTDLLGKGAPPAPVNRDDVPVLEFLVTRRAPAAGVVDAIARSPGRFGVDPAAGIERMAPRRAARRAHAYARLDETLFRRAFGPYLDADPELREAYDALVRGR